MRTAINIIVALMIVLFGAICFWFSPFVEYSDSPMVWIIVRIGGAMVAFPALFGWLYFFSTNYDTASTNITSDIAKYEVGRNSHSNALSYVRHLDETQPGWDDDEDTLAQALTIYAYKTNQYEQEKPAIYQRRY